MDEPTGWVSKSVSIRLLDVQGGAGERTDLGRGSGAWGMVLCGHSTPVARFCYRT
jgi:ABC-type phosphonate transport system ATPase subunit